MRKKDLKTTEYDAYYARYINEVSDETSLRQGLESTKETLLNFFSSIPKEKLEYRYEPEKWSVKEVLQHIIDTERVFIYRLFRIARKDTTALAGFDQNLFIIPSEAHNKSLNELLGEFTTTRLYSINIINSISDKNLMTIGTASNTALSARACAYIILGHSIWHINIIKKRYLLC